MHTALLLSGFGSASFATGLFTQGWALQAAQAVTVASFKALLQALLGLLQSEPEQAELLASQLRCLVLELGEMQLQGGVPAAVALACLAVLLGSRQLQQQLVQRLQARRAAQDEVLGELLCAVEAAQCFCPRQHALPLLADHEFVAAAVGCVAREADEMKVGLPPAACRLPPAACRLPPAACRLPPAASDPPASLHMVSCACAAWPVHVLHGLCMCCMASRVHGEAPLQWAPLQWARLQWAPLQWAQLQWAPLRIVQSLSSSRALSTTSTTT
jgi:hypothetical protein